MITIDGISGAWNYTIGNIVVWEGAKSLDKINFRDLPCVIVAKYIALEHLGKIDFPRVLGFVVEEGGPGDPTLIIYSNQHRATVLRATGALQHARDGETVVVDGVNGKVFFDPDEETVEKYKELRRQGPPPEPPGMIDKLMRVATDFKSLDPSAIKNEIISFDQLGAVMDGVLSAWRAEKLTAKQTADLKKFAKGTPVEGNILKNLERFEAIMKEREAEEAAAQKEAEPVAAGARVRTASSAEERRRARDEARAGGRGEDAKAGAETTATGAESKATATDANAAETTSTAEPAGDGKAMSAAEARRAQREAEIAAARAARRGGGDEKKS